MPLPLFPSSTHSAEEDRQTSDILLPPLSLAPACYHMSKEDDNNNVVSVMVPGDVYRTQGAPPMFFDSENECENECEIEEIEVIEGISPEDVMENVVEATRLPQNLQRSEPTSLMSISTGVHSFVPARSFPGESLAEYDGNALGIPRRRMLAAEQFNSPSPATASVDPAQYLRRGPTIEFQRLSCAYLDKLHEFCQRIIQHWQKHCTHPRFQPYFDFQEQNLANADRLLRLPHSPSRPLVEQRRDALRQFFHLLDKWEDYITHDISCAYVPEYKKFCLELAKGKEVVRIRFGEFNLWRQIIKRHTGESYTEIASHDTGPVELVGTVQRPVSGPRTRIPRPVAPPSN